MRFALVIVTRGNPQRAAAVLELARYLSSGSHEVEYIVSCDDDDPADTAGFFNRCTGVTVSCAARPPGVPECFNRVIRSIDADAYLGLTDDGFPLAQDWDVLSAEFIDGAFPSRSLAAFAWNDAANPGQATILMASREWIDLCGGEFMDPRFPFWFSDTAMSETWSFVTGRPIPINPALSVFSRAGEFNPRLRDIGFWWNFYVATRRERLALAADIRKKLGIELPQVVLDRTVEMWRKRDATGLKNAEEIAANLAPRPVDETYLRAKQSAETYMAKVA